MTVTPGPPEPIVDSAQEALGFLRVDGLSKRYGTVVTADRVSFEVQPGEALGVVGPNGAGKTTLLNLLCGVASSDGGAVMLDGRDITAMAADRRARAGLARTFQVPRPFSDMTLFENTLVAATFAGGHHGRGAHSRAWEALEVSGLADRANVPSGSLRLLDRKRLELARALATDPVLLMLDEIAGGLTEHELPALLDTIRDVKARGVSILWIEHVVHALVAIVDRLMCLVQGSVLAIGEPSAVLRDPEVVRVYLGAMFELDDMGGSD